jgi:hypothetical protein
LRKMVLAIPQAMLHSRAFHAFTEGLRNGHEEDLQKWEKMVRAWEVDQTLENPYEYPEVEGAYLIAKLCPWLIVGSGDPGRCNATHFRGRPHPSYG